MSLPVRKEWWKSRFVWFAAALFGKMLLFRDLVFHEFGVVPMLSDLFGSVLLAGLMELIGPKTLKNVVSSVVYLLVSFVLMAATVYFDYFGTVPTYTSLKQLHQLMEVSGSVKAAIRPVDFVYFADLIVFAALFLLLRARRRPLPALRASRGAIVYGSMAVAIIYAAVSIRASAHVTNELKRANDLGFVQYQAAVVLNAMRQSINHPFANPHEVETALDGLKRQHPGVAVQTTGARAAMFGSQKGKNVVVVQVEALQNFTLDLSVGREPVTPVLSGLAKDSYYFSRVFQQIGQGNTSDAEFLSNTSIYPTGTEAMSTGFGDRVLPSLPRVLQAQAYETATFHVNDVQFWDRDKLYPAIGFGRFYDKSSFRQDHFNSLGSSDEELYRVGLERLSEYKAQQKTFYAQFVTLSNHHPFQIPEDKKTLPLPVKLLGTQIGDYLQSVHYSDYALGRLIDGLKQRGLWDDTILVVYGDHFGLAPNDTDPRLVRDTLGINYHPRISGYNIPLIIHVPGQTGKKLEQTGGQADIMPTVANLLGIELRNSGVLPFGHDLLNTTHNVIGIRYYLPTGSFVNDDIMYMPGKGFDDGTALSLDTLEPVKDFARYRGDYEYALKLMGLSDNYVKLLPKRQPAS